MLEWIERKLLNRYAKSGIRYGIMVLVGALAGSDLPGIADLAEFLRDSAGPLSEITAAILAGLVATWSARKNAANSKMSPETK